MIASICLRPAALIVALTLAASHALLTPCAAAQYDEADLHELTLFANTTVIELDERNALLQAIMEKHKVPGLGAALVTSNGVEFVGTGGLRAFGRDEQVTNDDFWHLGSCTKSMAATLAAILVEQGKLKWESTLAEVFPDLASKMHKQYRGVTLAQLCSNRAGVPSSLDRDGLWGKLWNHRGTPTESRRMLLEGVIAYPPDFPPGTKYAYSNQGFAVAGLICETAAGKPFEELITELLFKPLGMTTAGFGAPGTPGKIDQPRGHDKNNKPQEPTADGRGADNPPAISPAGRVHCTIGDWAKYIRFHLRGGRGKNGTAQKIGAVTLSGETFKKLHTPPDALSDYAFGWSRPERPWAGPKGDRFVFTHNGSNTMWFCVVWVAPAKDLAVMACTNKAEGGAKATDEAVWMLIQDHLKRERGGKANPGPPD